MFGKQHDGKHETAPTCGFGSSDRSNLDKVFLTEEHQKSGYGKWSPGPVYTLQSTIGSQNVSKCDTSARYSFGSSNRFERTVERRSAEKPGPGTYSHSPSIGPQSTSIRRNAPKHRLGCATRDAEGKLFFSEEQAKSNLGINSPGPNIYDPPSSIGKQSVSRSATFPSHGFTSEERFRYDEEPETPGAGQYNSRSGYGRQMQSQKFTVPMHAFGSSTREADAKLYISNEHEKSQHGKQSPGPFTGGSQTAFGKQAISRKHSVPSHKLSSAKRFTYRKDDLPGPGSYD